MDTPNTTLRRLLGIDAQSRSDSRYSFQAPVMPSFVQEESVVYNQVSVFDSSDIPHYLPASLSHTLEMIDLVINKGQSRVEATKVLARKHHLTLPTISDKFTRQLSLSSYQVDALLIPAKLNEFKKILQYKYIDFSSEIETFFATTLANAKNGADT